MTLAGHLRTDATNMGSTLSRQWLTPSIVGALVSLALRDIHAIRSVVRSRRQPVRSPCHRR